jgi:hypothetical protein
MRHDARDGTLDRNNDITSVDVQSGRHAGGGAACEAAEMEEEQAAAPSLLRQRMRPQASASSSHRCRAAAAWLEHRIVAPPHCAGVTRRNGGRKSDSELKDAVTPQILTVCAARAPVTGSPAATRTTLMTALRKSPCQRGSERKTALAIWQCIYSIILLLLCG